MNNSRAPPPIASPIASAAATAETIVIITSVQEDCFGQKAFWSSVGSLCGAIIMIVIIVIIIVNMT
ncbi:hypothetical protein T484DRAFT_1842739 [Baffinella frigidus]|nr:hypothetical protein T484DRAFT_1842739 [Cryptophyta sp. CCMP2293]